MHTYLCVSGSKKRSFFGKFSVLCILVTSVLRFALCHITDDIWSATSDLRRWPISLNSKILYREPYIISFLSLILEKNKPSNSKQSGVCVYYRNLLPFKVINVKYLQECISYEIRVEGRCYKFVCLYRSPSQTHGEFETFLKNFLLTLDKIHENNPFMTSA